MQEIPIRLQTVLTEGYNDIVLFAEELLGMPLHEGQKQFLRSAQAKVNVLVPANRWGKSVTVAIKHIHHCFYKIGIGRGNTTAHSRAHYMTANLAPHSDATKPVFDAIKAILTSSFPIPQADGSVKNNECRIEWFLDYDRIRNTTPYVIPFMNNSQILFRSTGEDQGDSIQGKSFGYISYDEGGRSNHLEYELNSNVIPRLADLNGQLDIVSTPDMRSNSILFHYQLFKKGMNQDRGYYAQEGGIADNIFLLRQNPTYIDEETERLKGNPILDQVLYGRFVFAGDALYPVPDIEAALDDSLNSGTRYISGHTYILGVDTAMGEDEMVYTVIDTSVKPLQVVRQIGRKGNSVSPEIHANDFIDLAESYCKHDSDGNPDPSNIKIIIETWNGESANFYKELPRHFQGVTYCWGSWQPPGLPGNVATLRRRIKKAEILLALKKILANKELKIPNERVLIEQLSIYREDDKNLKTDRVMSLAIAAWLATDGAPKQEAVEFIELDEDW